VHVFISRRDIFGLPFALIAQLLDEATIQEHLIFAQRPAVLQDWGLRDIRFAFDRGGRIRPMARKLKTYQTSLGFFDQAIAAPSMKAALEAWGADSNLFHQGAAKESDDPDVIAATMAKPGVVLRRPVGTDRPFSEHAELPIDLVGGGPTKAIRNSKGAKTPKPSSRPVDKAAQRKAALAYERPAASANCARSRHISSPAP
jgi:hypothetical protein